MEEEQEDEVANLRDLFRESTISIVEAEAKRNVIDIAEVISVCIADLSFKYAEHLAKDLQLFALHAKRKSVKMEDVIISTHRNDNLTASMRSFGDSLAAKTPERSRRWRRKQMWITDDKEESSLDLDDDHEQEDYTATEINQ